MQQTGFGDWCWTSHLQASWSDCWLHVWVGGCHCWWATCRTNTCWCNCYQDKASQRAEFTSVSCLGRAWASPGYKSNIRCTRCYVCMYVSMYVAIHRPRVHSVCAVCWLITSSCLVQWFSGSLSIDDPYRIAHMPLTKTFSCFKMHRLVSSLINYVRQVVVSPSILNIMFEVQNNRFVLRVVIINFMNAKYEWTTQKCSDWATDCLDFPLRYTAMIFHNTILGGKPCRNGSKPMAQQPPIGISLECLKEQATKDLLILFKTSFLLVSAVINPRRACARVTVVIPCVCVCLSVCYHASCYIPRSFVCWNQGAVKLPVSFSTHALCGFHWKRFVQKFWRHLLITSALFASWKTLMDKTDSEGFFSRWLVCGSSDRSYNSTGWSLVIVNCQLRFLTWTVLNYM